jgi:hypothetical protein
VESWKTLPLAFVLVVAFEAPARASDVTGDTPSVSVSDEAAPAAKTRRVRIVLGATSALTALVDATRTWSWSFGASLGITRTGSGLGGFAQIGYLSPSDHWDHAIPLDVGGQYRWGDLHRSLFVSGGMSFITFSPRPGMAPESTLELAGGWQVVPLVYVDLGGRLMLAEHFGLDFKIEARTYWVINIVAAKLSLAF